MLLQTPKLEGKYCCILFHQMVPISSMKTMSRLTVAPSALAPPRMRLHVCPGTIPCLNFYKVNKRENKRTAVSAKTPTYFHLRIIYYRHDTAGSIVPSPAMQPCPRTRLHELIMRLRTDHQRFDMSHARHQTPGRSIPACNVRSVGIQGFRVQYSL